MVDCLLVPLYTVVCLRTVAAIFVGPSISAIVWNVQETAPGVFLWVPLSTLIHLRMMATFRGPGRAVRRNVYGYGRTHYDRQLYKTSLRCGYGFLPYMYSRITDDTGCLVSQGSVNVHGLTPFDFVQD